MRSKQVAGIGMTSLRTRRRLVDRLRQSGISNQEVLDVMLNTPRHVFVDEALAHRAYDDTALPIGHGQTISQPYIVARMTERLMEYSPKRVLEIGTGSGYQASILAQLVDELYTVERIEPLLSAARKRFRSLRLSNIRAKYSDGSWGWKDAAPFDAIIVTAAPNEIPVALLEQLKLGGPLLGPVGNAQSQQLELYIRTKNGIERQTLEPVSFVPLQGGLVS